MPSRTKYGHNYGQSSGFAEAGTYPTVCPATPIDLIATATGGGGGYQYHWSNNLGNTAAVDVVANFSTTYSVTVTDANGCTSTDQTMINVHPAVIVFTAPQSANICPGNSLSLNATAVGGSGAINLTWSDGQSGSNIIVTPSASTNLIVTATDANNCQSRDTIIITLFPAISVTTPPSQQACAGQQVALVASANGGSGTINYNWDNGLGAGQTHSPVIFNTTTYNVTATDANNCSSSNNVTVFVTQPPTAFAGVDQTICTGQSANLSGLIGGTATTAFWTSSVSGGSFTPGTNSLNASYSPPPGYTGQITLELRTNTAGPCLAGVDFMTISVFPAPTFVVQEVDCAPSLETFSIQFESDALAVTSPQGPISSLGGQVYLLDNIPVGTNVVITTTGSNCTKEQPVNSPDCSCQQQGILIEQPSSEGDIVICEDDSLPPLIVDVQQGLQVNWFASPTGNDTVAVNTTGYAATEAGTYYAEAIDPISGCLSPVRTAVSLVIKENPIAEAGENQFVCFGGSTTLEALTDNSYTYEWSTGETSAQIDVVVTSPSLYFLTVTLDGCSAADSVRVDIHPLIIADIEVGSQILCHNDETGELSIDVTGGTPSFDILWSTGDTTAILAGLPAGDYSATITDGNGCEITLTEALLNPPLLVLNDTTITDAGLNQNNGAIDIDIAGGTSPLQFFWTRLEDGTTFQSEDLNNLQPGMYALAVTDANLCTLLDTFVVNMITSTTAAGIGAEVRIFPNPTRDKLYIAVQQLHVAEAHVELLDILGRSLHLRREQIGTHALLEVDMEALPAGMYTVKITIGTAVVTHKVTKQ
ncbi:MAG: T9SS type A sorting domain-containing protein [Saprospiraceae bacterium]|nr:T9SS type A sorting domain-containing protein [Saprospiraceae bacterium]